MALQAQQSAKLDIVVQIIGFSVADPEQDAVTYTVRLDGDIVKRWSLPGYELDAGQPNVVHLTLDIEGLETEAVGVFPAGTDLIYGDERWTIQKFLPGEPTQFDYYPQVSADGQKATFVADQDGEALPGLNQRYAGAVCLRAELNKPFPWPDAYKRSVEVEVGYGTAPGGGLFTEEPRDVWGRLEEQRAVPAVSDLDAPADYVKVEHRTEWLIGDEKAKIGDVLVYENRRHLIQEVEKFDRSHVARIVATLTG